MMDKEKEVVKRVLNSLHKDEHFNLLMRLECNKSIEEYEFYENYKGHIKSIKHSEEARLKGNHLFTSSHHDSLVHYRIIISYNESIADAPANSEILATAYANKAAILLHICKYRESISEIDKAFRITKSTALKVKLLCRRAKCLTSLGSPDNRKYLSKATFWLNKFEGDKKVEEVLKNMLQSAEKCVDEASDDTMKLYRENARLSKEIYKAEITCDNSVEIAYSEKYENHLIAARDIKPGEILVVEKTFSTLHPEKSYAYCGHCTSFLWEIVPCETCSNISFCSEKCKSEAWEQYHDVECTISVFLLLFHKGAKTLHPQVGLKMFITAIRQAGSIQVLRDSLESLEKCKRKFIDFSENGKYIDYRHVYALSSKNFNELEENFVCYWSTINLFILAKFPSPVRKFFTFQNFNPAKLMKNSDFLFLGSLLLRFCAISATHCTQAFKVEHDMRHPIDTQRCLMTGCCTVSIAFGVRSSLVPPSCVPNAGRTVIENNRIILYAIQPIKKGAQILRSGGLSIFQDTPKYMRQEAIRELTGSDCDCQACAENWPVLDLLANPYEGFPYLSPEESDVRREIESTLMQFGDLDTLSAKKISKFSKIVEDMVGRSPLPSKLTALAINCLYGLIDVSHGFQNKPRVPHECIT